jgi:hypothetical protein
MGAPLQQFVNSGLVITQTIPQAFLAAAGPIHESIELLFNTQQTT